MQMNEFIVSLLTIQSKRKKNSRKKKLKSDRECANDFTLKNKTKKKKSFKRNIKSRKIEWEHVRFQSKCDLHLPMARAQKYVWSPSSSSKLSLLHILRTSIWWLRQTTKLCQTIAIWRTAKASVEKKTTKNKRRLNRIEWSSICLLFDSSVDRSFLICGNRWVFLLNNLCLPFDRQCQREQNGLLVERSLLENDAHAKWSTSLSSQRQQ